MNLSALAEQIRTLTHSVDRLEQIAKLIDSEPGPLLDQEIAVLHDTIDALNALYQKEESRQFQ